MLSIHYDNIAVVIKCHITGVTFFMGMFIYLRFDRTLGLRL